MKSRLELLSAQGTPVEVIHPDVFLLDVLDLRPPKVLAALGRQVRNYR